MSLPYINGIFVMIFVIHNNNYLIMFFCVPQISMNVKQLPMDVRSMHEYNQQ